MKLHLTGLRLLGFAPALALALLLPACGGGIDQTKAQLRLVNASSGYDALDLHIDDQRRLGAIGYGATATYVAVDPAKADSVLSRPGSATALATLTPALTKDRYFTLLAYGSEGALKTVLLDDNADAPVSGKTSLRVLNAAADAGPLDVFVTAADEALATAVPLQAGAAVGVLGSAASVNSGAWRLRVTAAGSRSDLRFDMTGVTLVSREVLTLVLTPSRGGALVNALLLVQRGGIGRHDTALARARIAAGLPAGGTVGASLAGVMLAAGVGSPALSGYTLVPAGASSLAVTVNGIPLSAPVTTLAPGGDHTLLVHGLVSAPSAVWLADDNRAPAGGTTAKLRLVHGVAALATPLALSADFLPVADGVTAGVASSYAAVTASASTLLTVTTPGAAGPLFSATDQRLDAGGVYSLFVVGGAMAPVGILRKDR